MDFFSDLIDQPTTPVYSKFHPQTDHRSTKNVKFSSQTKKSNDDFDDLLDNLLSKQELKKSRKNIEPYSSQNLASDGFGRTLQRYSTSYNLQTEMNAVNNNYYPPPLSRDGNKASKKSILDDLGYDDNKSYKSGATGRRGQLPVESVALINIKGSPGDEIPLVQASMRGGMRPPLKKRPESRENSIYDGDKLKLDQEQIDIDNSFKMNKRNIIRDDKVKQQTTDIFKSFKPEQSSARNNQFLFPQSQPFLNQPTSGRQSSPQQKVQRSNQSPIIQQKLIQKHIHIPPAELTKRHEEEINLIKQSYQRQLKSMKQNYQKIINQQSQARKSVTSMMDQAVQKERRKYEKMMEEQVKRVKQVSQWQIKKKTEGYEMQVKRLKQLLDTVSKSQFTKLQPEQSLTQQQVHQLAIKQKELNSERQSIDQQRFIMQTQRRQFQSQQHEFQLYRRRQEQKLADQRKSLFQQQMQLKKIQLQTKKQIMTEKQLISTQLVETQLIIQQQKQTLNHEKEKLNLQKELFNQQKMQYERINQKIIDDLRDRKKDVQKEKQQVTQLQVQLYKKIHLMEMAAVEKGLGGHVADNKNIMRNKLNNTGMLMKTSKSVNKGFQNRQSLHKQNNRNRINSQLNDKIVQTKHRYMEMQKLSRTNSLYEPGQRDMSMVSGPKIHLDKYIEKLTRDKLKLMK